MWVSKPVVLWCHNSKTTSQSFFQSLECLFFVIFLNYGVCKLWISQLLYISVLPTKWGSRWVGDGTML
jgi:hypothetical protein